MYLLRPSKYVKYTATMTYGNRPNRFQLNWPTAKVAQVGFYAKWLLSLACVILDQENLHNFTRNCKPRNFLICWKPFSICVCAFHILKKGGAQACGTRRGGAHAKIVQEHNVDFVAILDILYSSNTPIYLLIRITCIITH